MRTDNTLRNNTVLFKGSRYKYLPAAFMFVFIPLQFLSFYLLKGMVITVGKTELEQIRQLNLADITADHILEIGADVVSALRDTLGEDTLKTIFEEIRGESDEGFGERLAERLEEYLEPEREAPVAVEIQPVEETDDLRADISQRLEEMRSHYKEAQETHLSRNIFVSWEKLRIDIAARQAGEVGADGKRLVSGGTIAVDIMGIIRGNIFETLIETAVRGILDSIFPAEPRDPVTAEETAGREIEAAAVGEQIMPEVSDAYGMLDNGLLNNGTELLESDTVNTIRMSNPLYGQHFGFDVTENGWHTGSMTVYRNEYPQRVDVVDSGTVKTLSIPSIRMVELYGNFYHVSPFGKILNSDINNVKTDLPIGSSISQLDISKGKNAELFEKLAENEGVSLEQLKERYTVAAEDKFVSRVESSLEVHGAYLRDSAIPETREIADSYRRDLLVLDSRETVLSRELTEVKNGEQQSIFIDREKVLQDKIDEIHGLKEELEKGIASCEERVERLEATLERYDECRQELAEKGADSYDRYMAASNTEKEAFGRSDSLEYIPKDIERAVSAAVERERPEFMADVERYNEKNPDNQLREKDGELYNRFGISETGRYDADMCVESEKVENMEPHELDEYERVHARDGFEEFRASLEERLTEVTEAVSREETSAAVIETAGTVETAVELEEPGETDKLLAADTSLEETEQVRGQVEVPIGKDTDGAYAGDVEQGEVAAAELDSVTSAEEITEHISVDPVAAANAEEDSQEQEDRDNVIQEEDKEEDEAPDLQNSIADEFSEYLNSDTYSFETDFLENIGREELSSPEAEKVMFNVLGDLYMDDNISLDDRLLSLTFEVASFSEHGIMPAIESLISSLAEKGLNEYEIAQILDGIEPVVFEGIRDLVMISEIDHDSRSIRIGEDSWTISPGSIVNDSTGVEEEPEKLTDLIVGAVDKTLGDGIGNATADQALTSLQEQGIQDISSHEMDFLDQFFGGALESTLQQVYNDFIPESMRDMVSKDDNPFITAETAVGMEEYEAPAADTDLDGVDLEDIF